MVRFKNFLNESEKTITVKSVISGWEKVGIKCEVLEIQEDTGLTILVAHDTIEDSYNGEDFVSKKVEKFFDRLQNNYSNIIIGGPGEVLYQLEPKKDHDVDYESTVIGVRPDKTFYINKLKQLSLGELKDIVSKL